MDTLIFSIFVCISIPMAFTLFILEKKSRLIIGYMIIGMGVCLYISGINGLLLNVFKNDNFYVTTTITPITEEIAKSLPILFYAFLISDKRDKILSLSLAIGMGFAILENTFIFMNSDTVTFGWALIRAFGAGLMHSICTMVVGYGISFVRKRKKLFVCGTFALLTAAIIYHAIYNLLVQSDFEILGLLLPTITYIPFIIFYRKKKNQKMQKDI